MILLTNLHLFLFHSVLHCRPTDPQLNQNVYLLVMF